APQPHKDAAMPATFWRPLVHSAAVTMVSVAAVTAQPAAVTWTPYADLVYGFSAERPPGRFSVHASERRPGRSRAEVGGEAQLSLYGGPAEGMDRDALAARLSAGEQIGTITYRAGGESWFVLSGFYEPLGPGDLTIFYTEVLFSPDHQTFSAFEISFPANDKPRFEALVERFEDSFTRPRG